MLTVPVFPGVALILLLIVLPSSAQVLLNQYVDGFIGRLYQNVVRRTMLYRLHIPDNYNKDQQYPMVVWLHGAGGAGDDNLLQIQDDQTAGTHLWISPEQQAKHPAFVVAPQSTRSWIHDGRNVMSQEMILVLGIVDKLQKEFNIDPNRLYIAGQSDGAFGVWNIISIHPEVFSAAIIVSGGGNPSYADRLIQTPLWVFHGDKDEFVPVRESRQMVEAVKKAGGNPRYTEYKGAGHDIWNRVFAEPDLPDWLFTQHK